MIEHRGYKYIGLILILTGALFMAYTLWVLYLKKMGFARQGKLLLFSWIAIVGMAIIHYFLSNPLIALAILVLSIPVLLGFILENAREKSQKSGKKKHK